MIIKENTLYLSPDELPVNGEKTINGKSLTNITKIVINPGPEMIVCGNVFNQRNRQISKS